MSSFHNTRCNLRKSLCASGQGIFDPVLEPAKALQPEENHPIDHAARGCALHWHRTTRISDCGRIVRSQFRSSTPRAIFEVLLQQSDRFDVPTWSSRDGRSTRISDISGTLLFNHLFLAARLAAASVGCCGGCHCKCQQGILEPARLNMVNLFRRCGGSFRPRSQCRNTDYGSSVGHFLA